MSKAFVECTKTSVTDCMLDRLISNIAEAYLVKKSYLQLHFIAGVVTIVFYNHCLFYKEFFSVHFKILLFFQIQTRMMFFLRKVLVQNIIESIYKKHN